MTREDIDLYNLTNSSAKKLYYVIIIFTISLVLTYYNYTNKVQG